MTVVPITAAKPPAPTCVPLGVTSGNKTLDLDLAKVLAGRLLIQGSSGAGKSATLRHIVEEAFEFVTVMIVDPEGEFENLARHIGATTLRAAELVNEGLTAAAARARHHRLPLHLDLTDLEPDRRIEKAAAFFAGLLGSPREDWANTVLVCIDEGHLLAPHLAASARDAETRRLGVATLTDLCARGRKRGIGTIVASQRLAKLAGSVVSELHNVLIGLTVFDRDVARAADLLGFDTTRADMLRRLAPGEFYAFGPALTMTPLLLKVSETITQHSGKTPDLLGPSDLAADDGRSLLNLDALKETPTPRSEGARGSRALDGFLLDAAAPAAARIIGALRTIAPNATSAAELGKHLGLEPADIDAGLDLLGSLGAVDTMPRGDDRIARLAARLRPAGGGCTCGGAGMSAVVDLSADVVELAVYVPPAPAGALREMVYRPDAWMPAEDDRLRSLFGDDEGVAEIAKALGRTFHAVRARIDQLGLRRNSTRPWSDMEDAELLRRYGDEPCARLAANFGRSCSAIYARASLLSLTEAAAPDYEPWEDAQIVAGYEAGIPVGQIATLIGRPLLGVRSRATILGVRHPSQPPNWSDQEATRALELAHEGHRYLAIIEKLVDEGFPRRSKNGFGQRLRILGYGRGWGRAWLPDEDELLRRAYATAASLTPLRDRLGRTACSIRWRVEYLGLRGTHAKKDGWRGEIWTPEDEQRLRDGFGKIASAELAKQLGRTKAAMFTRANILGLVHGWIRAFTPDEDRAIEISWRRGLSMVDLSEACNRDPAVVGKHAARLGFSFSDPNRPVRGPRGRRGDRPKLSVAEILALEPQDKLGETNDREHAPAGAVPAPQPVVEERASREVSQEAGRTACRDNRSARIAAESRRRTVGGGRGGVRGRRRRAPLSGARAADQGEA